MAGASFTLDSIDVAKDIIDVKILMNDDDEEEGLSFSVTLLNWTETEIDLFLNFSDPERVSSSYNADLLYFQIKNPELFRSKLTRNKVTKSNILV